VFTTTWAATNCHFCQERVRSANNFLAPKGAVNEKRLKNTNLIEKRVERLPVDFRLELLLTLRLRNEVDFDVGIGDTPDVHGRKVGGLIQEKSSRYVKSIIFSISLL